MAENINNPPPAKDTLTKKNYYTSMIYTDDNRVAKASNTPGTELPIKNFIDGKGMSINNGEEKYPVDRIYFKTETGNIYGIKYSEENKGEIINARHDITSTIANRDPRTEGPIKFVVGEEFHYKDQWGSSLHTTKIVEVLTTSNIQKSNTELWNMSKGKRSSILQDFKDLRLKAKK